MQDGEAIGPAWSASLAPCWRLLRARRSAWRRGAAAGVLERLGALARDHDEIRSVSVMGSGDRAPRGIAAAAGRTKLASRAIGVPGPTCRRAEAAKICPVTGAWRRDAGCSQVLEPTRPELGT